MIIKHGNHTEIHVTINVDGSATAKFYEYGCYLGSETWKHLSELIEEYC